MDTHLDFAFENYEAFLEEALDEISVGSSSADVYFTVVQSYRILALCALLLEADPTKFAAHCARGAFARLAFLRKIETADNVHPKYVCASKDIAFSAALAAGAMEAASELAKRSPDRYFSAYEYEDDFLFFHFMHRAVMNPTEDQSLGHIIDRWTEVLDGESSGYLEVCRVLWLRDQSQLPEALYALTETRQTQLERYQSALNFSPELYATEGKVFLEGVALLRLAEMRGLQPDAEYRFIPGIARVPLDLELPPFDSWRKYP